MRTDFRFFLFVRFISFSLSLFQLSFCFLLASFIGSYAYYCTLMAILLARCNFPHTPKQIHKTQTQRHTDTHLPEMDRDSGCAIVLCVCVSVCVCVWKVFKWIWISISRSLVAWLVHWNSGQSSLASHISIKAYTLSAAYTAAMYTRFFSHSMQTISLIHGKWRASFCRRHQQFRSQLTIWIWRSPLFSSFLSLCLTLSSPSSFDCMCYIDMIVNWT